MVPLHISGGLEVKSALIKKKISLTSCKKEKERNKEKRRKLVKKKEEKPVLFLSLDLSGQFLSATISRNTQYTLVDDQSGIQSKVRKWVKLRPMCSSLNGPNSCPACAPPSLGSQRPPFTPMIGPVPTRSTIPNIGPGSVKSHISLVQGQNLAVLTMVRGLTVGQLRSHLFKVIIHYF